MYIVHSTIMGAYDLQDEMDKPEKDETRKCRWTD